MAYKEGEVLPSAHLVIEAASAGVVIVGAAVRPAPTLGVRNTKILETNNHLCL